MKKRRIFAVILGLAILGFAFQWALRRYIEATAQTIRGKKTVAARQQQQEPHRYRLK